MSTTDSNTSPTDNSQPPLASELSEVEIDQLEAAADEHLVGGGDDRLNIRWPRASLETVRQAANVLGVPYQTYIKQVAVRQALTDLKDAALAGRLPR